jgi:hypothetical protein
MSELTERVAALADQTANSPVFEKAARECVGDPLQKHSLHQRIQENLNSIDHRVGGVGTLIQDRVLDITEHFGVSPSHEALLKTFMESVPALRYLGKDTIELLVRDMVKAGG